MPEPEGVATLHAQTLHALPVSAPLPKFRARFIIFQNHQTNALDHYLERVVDLLDPALNRICNMTVAEALPRAQRLA